MGSTDIHTGPDSMQQESQCASCADDVQTDDAEHECADPGNGCKENQGPTEGEQMALVQEPYPKTVTGVIRIMRATGRKSAAEFWEELHETERQAELLLKSLQKLHRKKTGCHQQIEKRSSDDE